MQQAIHYQRPPLYPKQLAFIDCPKPITVIEATTKAGKTASCMIWQLEQVLKDTRGFGFHWWCAPVRDTAKIAYTRAKVWLRKSKILPLCKTNEQEQSILFPNGITWVFKGTERPDFLYGEDVGSIVIDEATRVREQSWHALFTTRTATNAPMKIIGNVKGRQNWAYRLARRAEQAQAEAGNADAAFLGYFKLTAFDAIAGFEQLGLTVGVINRETVELARKLLPNAVFRELYLAEPSEDGSNPFGTDAIRKCTVDMLSENQTVVNGVDLGKRVDYTWVIGLDREGAMTRGLQWRRIDWGTTKDRIVEICGNELTVCDATGVGDPICDDLIARGMNLVPYVYTMPSKQMLMEALAVALQQGSVKITGDVLINELNSFTFEVTRLGVRYTAPEGMHDDGVCALAEAVWALRTFQPTEIYPGTRRETAEKMHEMTRNGKGSMAEQSRRAMRWAA